MSDNQIKALTSSCARNDCAITYDGSTSTLMAFSQTFDRDGNPIARDPNIVISRYSCHSCGMMWDVRSKDGVKATIIIDRAARSAAEEASSEGVTS